MGNGAGPGLNAGTPGEFTVRTTDSSTGTGPHAGTSSTISLTIGAPSLVFSPSTLTAATVGAAYSQAISVTGGTAPYGSFSLASGSLPLGLSLNSSGTVSGTPTQGGTFTFTVRSTDSSTGTGAPFTGTSTTLSLTVAPPTITVAPASLPAVGYGAAYSQAISASGGTSPYTYSLSGGTLPTGLSLSSGGVLSGITTQSGSYPITVTATDSSATPYSKNAVYTLTVNAQMPVAGAVSATVAYNTATPITLNLSGGTPTSVAVATGASHGTATASGTSITYTPTVGYVGSDSFTYTATNAGGTSAPATVSVTVTGSADLASLGLSAGTLAPAFASGTTSYATRVAHGVAALHITAQTVDPAATLRVNGSPLANGATSGDIALSDGANTITIEATAQDSTRKTYTVTVTRTGPATFSANSPTGQAGAITATISGGSLCGFDSAQFINAAPGVSPSVPTGKALPYGVFDFTASGCGPTTTVTLTYPQPLAAGTQYWKYGPTPTRADPHWYEMPASFQGQTVSFDIVDGGLGDDDFALGANGRIVDAGGVAVAAATGVTGIPALTPWALLSLSAALAVLGAARRRRVG